MRKQRVLHLPTTEKQWEEAYAAHKPPESAMDGEKLDPATKIKFWQYLLLRVLWKTSDATAIRQKGLDLDPWIERAKEMLAEYNSWKLYCDSFGPDEDKGLLLWRGIINSRPRRSKAILNQMQQSLQGLQLETSMNKSTTKDADVFTASDYDDSDFEESIKLPLETISPPPKELLDLLYPPTEDEQIVNAAFVLFLNALTIHFRLSNKWTFHRRAFTVEFQGLSFEARTDGYLKDKRFGKVRSIIEVKPKMREKAPRLIRMQESAQMVGRILEDSQMFGKSPGRRVHISQDRHEIYITIAEYKDDYLKYLKGELRDDEPAPFLTMYEYGPWDTTDQSHMEDLGEILLAITLRAQQDQKEELPQDKTPEQKKKG